MMGARAAGGATLTAIASANYIARRLDGTTRCSTPVRTEWWPRVHPRPAPITKATGVTVDDVAKRLADYGFHAPTMSFPVAGTLMVEPTESESLAEGRAFCEAMIAIRAEIDKVGSGQWPLEDNPLRATPAYGGVPSGSSGITRTAVRRRRTRWAKGFRPKVWPPVRRIDGAYGDHNLVCSCPPVESVRAQLTDSAPARLRAPVARRRPHGVHRAGRVFVRSSGGAGESGPTVLLLHGFPPAPTISATSPGGSVTGPG